MKVIVYKPDYNPKLTTIMKAFAEGVPGAEIRDQRKYKPCDIAVIFGVVKRAYKKTWSKQRILDAHSGRSLIIIESAFVSRGQYWQVGFGGFAGTGDFRNDDMPVDRWLSFNVNSKPWKRRPDGPVVVMGQLPRDTTVQNTDHPKWCRETVRYYESLGQSVLFRPHPRIENAEVYGIPASLHDTRDLQEVLHEARCFVTYNSTTGVDGAVKGVPVIAMDRGSMAWPVANHKLSDIHNLSYPDRDAWLAGLGYSQWSLDEMRAGLPWKHLTRS